MDALILFSVDPLGRLVRRVLFVDAQVQSYLQAASNQLAVQSYLRTFLPEHEVLMEVQAVDELLDTTTAAADDDEDEEDGQGGSW